MTDFILNHAPYIITSILSFQVGLNIGALIGRMKS